jgi:dihydropteroate synthase
MLATRAGVDQDRVLIDPGIGFGKDREGNLEIVRRLPELGRLGSPIVVGPSRKSFIGKTLDLPVEERREGTAAVVALSVAGGADIVRVHDVRAMVRVARMADAVVRGPSS